MWLEGSLTAWSFIAATWQLYTLRATRKQSHPPMEDMGGPGLIIFRALPPVDDPARIAPLARCLDSLSHQLRTDDRLLLGIPQKDLAAWEKHLSGLPPQAERITLPAPGEESLPANPKITAFRQLAAQASEGCWLWSDADIRYPDGYLGRLRTAWTKARDNGARLLTGTYLIDDLSNPRALPDALLANFQIFPGLVFLNQTSQLDSATGAVTIFESTDFHKAFKWDELEDSLADDNLLGQRLRPITLMEEPVVTLPVVSSWGEAWRHLLRWQKTIHWCRPLASASQLVVHPLIGWLAAWLFTGSPSCAAGVLSWMLWEGLITGIVFHRQGATIEGTALPHLILTAPLRSGAWLAAWMPLPAWWGELRWYGLKTEEPVGPRRIWARLCTIAPWAAWWITSFPSALHPWQGVLTFAAWFSFAWRSADLLKPVDWIFGVYFGLLLFPAAGSWLQSWPTGTALNVLLFAMALVSLFAGNPFSLAYARDEAPRTIWNHPRFLEANRVITAMWTLVFLGNILWLVRMAGTDSALVRWALPATALGAAALFTRLLAGWYRRSMEGHNNGENHA